MAKKGKYTLEDFGGDNSRYLRERERKNRNNRIYRARKKQMQEAQKLQNMLNNTRMSESAKKKVTAQMEMHIQNAESMRVKDRQGHIIEGRTSVTAEANRQRIMQEEYARTFTNTEYSRGDYERNKKMILSDFKNLERTRRSDVDIFKVVTKDLWVGADSTEEMLDMVMDYFQNYDFDFVFEQIVEQAKDKADARTFNFKVDKDSFTDEQREVYDLLQKNDTSDAEKKYKSVVAANITIDDIVIES